MFIAIECTSYTYALSTCIWDHPQSFFFPILYEWGKLPMQLKLWLLCHSCSFSKWWTARLIKILAVTAIKKYNFINKSPSQEKGEKADGLQIRKVISISILVHAGSSDLCNKSRTLKTSTRKRIVLEVQMCWLFRIKWVSFCKCIPPSLDRSFQKVLVVKQN